MQLGIEIYGRLGACYCTEIEFVSCELRFGRFSVWVQVARNQLWNEFDKWCSPQ